MMVGLLEIDLFAEGFHSLKEKRRLLSSLKERLKKNSTSPSPRAIPGPVAESAADGGDHRARPRRPGERVPQVEEFIELNYAVEISRLKVQFY